MIIFLLVWITNWWMTNVLFLIPLVNGKAFQVGYCCYFSLPSPCSSFSFYFSLFLSFLLYFILCVKDVHSPTLNMFLYICLRSMCKNGSAVSILVLPNLTMLFIGQDNAIKGLCSLAALCLVSLITLIFLCISVLFRLWMFFCKFLLYIQK